MTASEPAYTPPDTSLLGDEHVSRYEETNGEVGGVWNGATCLVLTTTGRKTGHNRGSSRLTVCPTATTTSWWLRRAARPLIPAGTLNVVANPDVTVQVMGDRFAAVKDGNARGAAAAVGGRQPGVAQLRGRRDVYYALRFPWSSSNPSNSDGVASCSLMW